MKISFLKPALALAWFAVTPLQLHAQGSVTPPGAPAATMKSLAQIEPRIDISTLAGDANNVCLITNSGAYYLTANLIGVTNKSGIGISADDVTLDLNGFAVIGVPGAQCGIIITGTRTNILVHNGNVSGWGNVGVLSSYGGNQVFEYLNVRGSKGFADISGYNTQISHCTAGNSSSGAYGIYAYYCDIHDCTVEASGSIGIEAYYSHVHDCTISASQLDGIFANNCDIHDCTVKSSGRYGISGQACTVRHCSVYIAATYGIELVLSGDVRDCHVESSMLDGIYLSSASGCQVTGNTVKGCNGGNSAAQAGITVSYGNNNRIEGNHLTANGAAGKGIAVTGSSTGNIIIQNSVIGNGANNYYLPSTQIVGPLITAAGTITSVNPWANFSF